MMLQIVHEIKLLRVIDLQVDDAVEVAVHHL